MSAKEQTLLVVPLRLHSGRWLYRVHCLACGRDRYTPKYSLVALLHRAHMKCCEFNPWLEKTG